MTGNQSKRTRPPETGWQSGYLGGLDSKIQARKKSLFKPKTSQKQTPSWLKEGLKVICKTQRFPGQSTVFLGTWCNDAEKSCIEQLKRVANTLMYHSHDPLNYYVYRISCSLVEGINSKIKTLKRQAYGFRDMTYFKLRLYHLHYQSYLLPEFCT
jgi:hypothetical protein